MRRRFTPARLAATGLLLLALVAVLLWRVPSDRYLLVPDPAHPVAPLVHVQGAKPAQPRGGIYFVDVFERRATLLERLFPGIHEGASLVPAGEIGPPCVSDTVRQQADQRAMKRSQQIAAAVALRQLGYSVVARPSGVVVDSVFCDSNAPGKLQPGDVVVAAQGHAVRTIAQLRAALRPHRPGFVASVVLRRGPEQRRVSIKTVRSPDNPRRPILGFLAEQDAHIRLPVSVRIDARGVGGPSAGLAFALQIMEALGRDVDHGRRVAATGQIELDGSISPIGGVKQKTIGARQAKVDVFLVPAGDNYRQAKRYAHGLRVVPVKSFQQALRALATTPPAR